MTKPELVIEAMRGNLVNVYCGNCRCVRLARYRYNRVGLICVSCGGAETCTCSSCLVGDERSRDDVDR